MAFRTPESQPNELPPAGMTVARCIKLINLGTQHSDFYKKSKRKVIISFELPQILHKGGNFDGQPFIVSKRYTLSHNEKSALRADLESWYGQSFNTEQLNRAGGFDLEKLLDRYALVNIVHTEDRQFANIKSINPLAKGMDKPRGYHPIVCFNLEEFSQGVFDSLSENLQNQIKTSSEYIALFKDNNDMPYAQTPDEPPFPEEAKDLSALPSAETQQRTAETFDEDDIPF